VNVDFKEFVAGIVENNAERLGIDLDLSSIRLFERPGFKDAVADASSIFFVDGKDRKNDITLILSNKDFPETVRNACELAISVHQRLDANEQRHVLVPLLEGVYGGQSYAVFSRLESFSKNKALRFAQKRFLQPKIADWLAALAVQTTTYCDTPKEVERAFIEPFEYLAEESKLPNAIRKFSETYLSADIGTRFQLFTTVHHGDFWSGNILSTRGAFPGFGFLTGDFRIIDWGTARLDGFPCIDIIRFANSSNRNTKAAGQIVRNYADAIEISHEEVALYAMASLGRLGLDRDQFPKSRFLAMTERIFDFLCVNDFT